MKFLIFIIAVILIILVIFCTWFLSYMADGKCPLCALKSIGRGKLTIDVSKTEDYDNNVSDTPIMGWSSWNTLRNHIDETRFTTPPKRCALRGLRRRVTNT